jgi:hypothetical protein
VTANGYMIIVSLITLENAPFFAGQPGKSTCGLYLDTYIVLMHLALITHYLWYKACEMMWKCPAAFSYRRGDTPQFERNKWRRSLGA